MQAWFMEQLFRVLKHFSDRSPLARILYYYFLGRPGGGRRVTLEDTIVANTDAAREKSIKAITTNQRLLAVWDFSSRPYSLGDILNFCIEVSMQVKRLNKDGADIYVLADPVIPAAGSQRGFIVRENYHQYLLDIMDAFFFCEDQRSIHIVSDRAELDAMLITATQQDVLTYPRFDVYTEELNGRKSQHHSNFGLMNKFKDEFGYFPKLKAPEGIKVLSNNLTFGFKPDTIFVAVHLRQRRNEAGTLAGGKVGRDAHFDHWIEFFEHAFQQHPNVTFVVCGRPAEFTRKLYQLPNVLILKAYGMNLQHELAMILEADLFMGSNSGPATVAIFSDTPYYIFQTKGNEQETADQCEIQVGDPHLKFANDDQFMVWGDTSTEKLISCLDEFVQRRQQQQPTATMQKEAKVC